VAQGLIAYGIVGLVVAAICLVALIWVNGRIGGLRAEAETTVSQLATSMERTANALHDASTTAQSFTVTVEESARAVSSAADTITEVRSGLGSLEAQLRAVSILGAQPLSATADAVGRIDASLEGLDTRLDGIAAGLEGNRDALARNATSLGQLGDSVEAMATRLDSGVIEDSLGDIQTVIVVILLVFTAWSMVPAVGALVAGLWLRRELERPGGEPLDQAP
jgi:methyl-accepting chemotaxis protein